MNKEALLEAIIIGYRNVITEKYAYETLKKRNDMPIAYSKAVSINIKNYFLEYSYPEPKKRQELNEAFQSLDHYLKNPEKLMRLVVDSVSIVFKYGKHLPKILGAGIKALKAFRRASKLEDALLVAALDSKKEPPFSAIDINTFLNELSKEQLDAYIKSINNLFEVLCDTRLMSKIKKILELLIKKMKDRPKIYSAQDISGLEIGQEIIVEADTIFNDLSAKEANEVFEFIMKMEKELLNLS